MSVAQRIPTVEVFDDATRREGAPDPVAAEILALPLTDQEADADGKRRHVARMAASFFGVIAVLTAIAVGIELYSRPEAPVAPAEPVVSPAPEPVVAEVDVTPPAFPAAELNARMDLLSATTPEIQAKPVVNSLPTELSVAPVVTTEVKAAAPAVPAAPPVTSQPSPARVDVVDVAELEARALRDVQRLIFSGDRVQAKRVLIDFMKRYGEREEPKGVLAGLLLQEGRLREANALLAAVDPATPSPILRSLRARILTTVGQPAEAIALLEAAPPRLSDAPDYHALLALAYQQASRFDESAAVYARLTELEPGNDRWWLGYGVGLDGAGKPEAAIVAFQQALDGRTLPGELADYALSRVRALSYQR